MTTTEFLIVGQGISGTFLSWYLYKEGRSFVVIDHYDPSSSSQVAAGIINPVTGRRIVKTWMIDELLPFALQAYKEIGLHLGVEVINNKKLVDFFPSPQMLNSFKSRVKENAAYLKFEDNPDAFTELFNYDFGYGEIDPCYIVNLKKLLSGWRQMLKNQNLLIEQKFDLLQNDNISADKIIYCDGIYSSTNPYFKNLPFALNKGEALIIESENIPSHSVYKKGLMLVPLGNHQFWVGSSHEWNFIDNLPSKAFLENTTSILSHWLRHPFRVVTQLAAIRPATVERRPFIGMHPHHPSLGIFNGMGTKGCSLAPYFAHQFVSHLTKNTPILPEADVKRFSRILNNSI